jgi:hypothetical protein
MEILPELRNKKVFLKVVMGKDNQIKALKIYSSSHYFAETFKFNVDILSIIVIKKNKKKQKNI